MLGLGLQPGGIPCARRAGGLAQAPFAVTRMVIEGDSITSPVPSTANAGYYSYRYASSRPDLVIEVRGQGGRMVGRPPSQSLNDDSNTLIGNVAEDVGYQPDLITAMIGANDLSSGLAAYKADMIAWSSAVRAARPGCRIAWSVPTPYNPDQSYPAYASYTQQRAALLAECRDPAVWGQWADYYLPMGEHPDFTASPPLTPSLWSDGVHPTTFDSGPAAAGGQNRLYDSYKAAIDSIADASRRNASAPYGSDWPVSETALATGTLVTRRIILSGLAHKGVAGTVSATGGAEVRVNGGAWGAAAGGGRLYNGDVVDLRILTSAAHNTAVSTNLTIGGETRIISYTTGQQVAPVGYTHGGISTAVDDWDTSYTVPAAPFGTGRAVVGLSTVSPGGAVAVTVGGVAAVKRISQLLIYDNARVEIWDAPVTAGSHDIVVTYAIGSAHRIVSYGTITGGEFVSAGGNSPASEDNPHLTPAAVIPANGLALAFFQQQGGAIIPAVTANAPTVLIDSATMEFQGGSWGITVASLGQSGSASFNHPFGSYARAIAVWRPVG